MKNKTSNNQSNNPARGPRKLPCGAFDIPCFVEVRDGVPASIRQAMKDASKKSFGVGNLVITKLKNRWNIECAGIIESINGDVANVRVWNINGPGADVLVTGIPMAELRPST